MPSPLEQFVKNLEESGVLAGETLKDFLPPKADPKDAEDLARELLKQKKLTKFQVAEVWQGKGKSLVLGNYLLIEKIGAGGMGQVFKARHRRMERFVAIKMLPPNVTKDQAAVARFEREVIAAAKINHPNIVAAHDADCANGVHFLVMELVEGNDLSALVKKEGPFPLVKTVNFILQAAKGLEAAHAVGIVHRDIKPANLLLDKKGTVKILDMGLARLNGDEDTATQAELTGTGTVMGTVDYMAPEQALNTKTADARADIYSLGCSFYYLLTGKATYGGDTLMAKLLAHREHPIPSLRASNPEVTEHLEAVFCKMIAKKVEDRFQTMTEVIAALESCGTNHQPSISTPQSFSTTSDTGLMNFLQDTPVRTIQKTQPTKKVAAKKSNKNQQPPWKNSKVLMGAATLGLLLLAGIIISLTTKEGMLVVTVDQPDAVVQVLDAEGKVEVSQKGDNGKVTIAIDPGKHRLRVEKEGFEFFTQDFEIESGGKSAIPAKLVPLGDEPGLAATRKPFVIEAPKAEVNDDGWKALFDGQTLTGWTGDVGLMTVENGVLVNDGKKGIVTAPGDYQNLEIEIEFRLANGGNSGLGICYAGSGDPSINGLEVQMIDDDAYPGLRNTQICGAVFKVAAAKPGHFKRWPEWNRLRVTSSESDLRVELNDVLVTDITRPQLKQLNSQHTGASRTTGKVCLFPHTGRSEYRSFRIRSPEQMPVKLLDSMAPPADAAVLNGHSYKFFSEVLTWREAKARCEEMGGHLATIESDAENNLVADLAENSIPNRNAMDGVWIGATDEHKEGEWKWIDGSPLSFTKWGPGQPSNKQDAEHYLLLYLAKREWSDQPLKSLQHMTYFVCEWDAAPPPAVAPFNADEAKAHQQAWAKYLGVPVEYTNSIGIKMILIPPGEYQMGTPSDEPWHSNFESPVHPVVITKPFYLGTFEVTSDQWKCVMESGPVPTTPGGNPAGGVSPLSAASFCEQLSEMQNEKSTGRRYRLPTEAEWEYACRAGTTTAYHFGPTFSEMDASCSATQPISKVGIYRPNAFGLFDMHGNIWECCKDYFSPTYYSENPKEDPQGPLQGTHRVLRGGGAGDHGELSCRAGSRLANEEARSYVTIGLRVACDLDEVPNRPKPFTDINSPAFQQWIKDVAALPAEQQVEAVSKKLVELNPAFDGQLAGRFGTGTPQIENGVVVGLYFSTENVADISPVRALRGLRWLTIPNGKQGSQLADLSPIKGLSLQALDIIGSQVSDLSPLQGMPLQYLACARAKVADLSPLKDMPLTHLQIEWTQVSDLSPLKGMPLKILYLDGNTLLANDLSPLEGMPLTRLYLHSSPFSDLSPLEGMPLELLDIRDSSVTDLSPLEGLPLKALMLDFKPDRDTGLLRSIKTLKTINDKPAAEFWKEVEAQQVAFQQWMKDVAALPAEQQVEAVSKKLMELNPGFDGKVTHKVENGVVVFLSILADNVTDISPLRGLAGLAFLTCQNSPSATTKLSDLSPLKGLPLQTLAIQNTGVSDLSPLEGMKLTKFYGGETMVTDLSPLRGMPLVLVSVFSNQAIDLSPLQEMSLKEINLDFQPERDTELLRSIKTLETINGKPAAEFWKILEEKQ
ncbi:MAG: SUMF1/EgtB/PvdO family nonheme iron enzyme [Planctomycetota bacterium]|nr:SUMF1/EgtB/PvdO family nonheme iron enzyme [Planctomycetota bacterium]